MRSCGFDSRPGYFFDAANHMASVYILFSVKLDRFYIGCCKDLEYRIEQHVNKEYHKSFTAKADDWVLFFNVDDLDYHQARLIENHIKKMRSTKYIENLKRYPEIFDRLKEKYA